MSYFCLKINNFNIFRRFKIKIKIYIYIFILNINRYNLKIIIRKKNVFNKLNKKKTSNNFLKY